MADTNLNNVDADESVFNFGNNNVSNITKNYYGLPDRMMREPNAAAHAFRRIHHISCDRTEIIDEIKKHFQNENFRTNPKPFYFFTLPAGRYQQADNLIERMTMELKSYVPVDKNLYHLSEENRFDFIKLPLGADEGSSRDAYRQKLLRIFQMRFESGDPVNENTFTLQNVCDSAYGQNYWCISLSFYVKAEELAKKHVMDFLEWMVKEFNVRTGNNPTFIFFMHVELPAIKKKFGGLLDFISRPEDPNAWFEPTRTRLERLNSLMPDQFINLKELRNINIGNVEEYLKRYYSTITEIQGFIRKHCPKEIKVGNDEMSDLEISMSDAEEMLQIIFKTYPPTRNIS